MFCLGPCYQLLDGNFCLAGDLGKFVEMSSVRKVKKIFFSCILTRDRPSLDAPANDHDVSHLIAVLHFTHANRENFYDSICPDSRSNVDPGKRHSQYLIIFFIRRKKNYLSKKIRYGRRRYLA